MEVSNHSENVSDVSVPYANDENIFEDSTNLIELDSETENNVELPNPDEEATEIVKDNSLKESSVVEFTEETEDVVNDSEGNNDIEGSEMIENSDVTDGVLPDNKKSDSSIQRLTRLPMSRIKSIIKFDDDIQYASQEAIFVITKATELFIDSFMKEVYQCTLASKKKTVSKRDVDTAVFSQDCFLFLDGALD